MSNEYDGSDPSDDEIVADAKRKNYEGIIEQIANMGDGEVFLYGSTYNEKMVIQADELHLMFCYHDELHMAKRDYGQDAWEVLNELSDNPAVINLLPPAMIARIKRVIDGPEAERLDEGKLPS